MIYTDRLHTPRVCTVCAFRLLVLAVLFAALPCLAVPRGTLFVFDALSSQPTVTAWHIAGTVRYDEWQTGAISVIAAPAESSFVGGKSVLCPKPGPYALAALCPGSNYWVWAFCDSSGNGSRDEFEPTGFFPLSPVCADSDVEGVDITLTAPDADGDGLPDWWEHLEFGDLSQAATMDSDGDGLANGQEYVAGLLPCCADSDGDGVDDGVDSHPAEPVDADADGLSDDWERRWFGDLSFSGSDDPDGDGTDNRGEFFAGSDPVTPNTTTTGGIHVLLYGIQ